VGGNHGEATKGQGPQGQKAKGSQTSEPQAPGAASRPQGQNQSQTQSCVQANSPQARRQGRPGAAPDVAARTGRHPDRAATLTVPVIESSGRRLWHRKRRS